MFKLTSNDLDSISNSSLAFRRFGTYQFDFNSARIIAQVGSNLVSIDPITLESSFICRIPQNAIFNGITKKGILFLKVNGGNLITNEPKNHDGGTLPISELIKSAFILDLASGDSINLIGSNFKFNFPESDIGFIYQAFYGERFIIGTSIYESGGRGDWEYFIGDLMNNFEKVSKIDTLIVNPINNYYIDKAIHDTNQRN